MRKQSLVSADHHPAWAEASVVLGIEVPEDALVSGSGGQRDGNEDVGDVGDVGDHYGSGDDDVNDNDDNDDDDADDNDVQQPPMDVLTSTLSITNQTK